MPLIFLFNVGGYYFGYLVLRFRAQVELTKHLDKGDYSESQSITVKIPLSVPYYSDGKGYERVNGGFEHRGEFFKLVKQKLENDTLYVVCIRDVKEKSLFGIMTNFARLYNDLPLTQKTLKLMSSMMKEYMSVHPVTAQAQSGWSPIVHFTSLPFELLHTDSIVFSPPPDTVG